MAVAENRPLSARPCLTLPLRMTCDVDGKAGASSARHPPAPLMTRGEAHERVRLMTSGVRIDQNWSPWPLPLGDDPRGKIIAKIEGEEKSTSTHGRSNRPKSSYRRYKVVPKLCDDEKIELSRAEPTLEVPQEDVSRIAVICPAIVRRGLCMLPDCPYVHESIASRRLADTPACRAMPWEMCRPTHPVDRHECSFVPCRFMYTLGTCINGNLCNYSHDPLAMARATSSSLWKRKTPNTPQPQAQSLRRRRGATRKFRSERENPFWAGLSTTLEQTTELQQTSPEGFQEDLKKCPERAATRNRSPRRASVPPGPGAWSASITRMMERRAARQAEEFHEQEGLDVTILPHHLTSPPAHVPPAVAESIPTPIRTPSRAGSVSHRQERRLGATPPKSHWAAFTHGVNPEGSTLEGAGHATTSTRPASSMAELDRLGRRTSI